MPDIPTFGTLPKDMPYATRIGAYVVIPDTARQRILTLAAPNGALILPGAKWRLGRISKRPLPGN